MKIQAVHSAGDINRRSSRQLAIYELNRAVGILENKIRLARDNMRWLRNESKALSGDLTAMAGSTDAVQRDLKVACDDLAKLQMALETDRYLTNVIGKLIQYEKSIRLVVCYVNPGRGSGQPKQPCGQSRVKACGGPCASHFSGPHSQKLAIIIITSQQSWPR